MGVAPLGLRQWVAHRTFYKHTTPLGLLSIQTRVHFYKEQNLGGVIKNTRETTKPLLNPKLFSNSRYYRTFSFLNGSAEKAVDIKLLTRHN